MRISSIVVVLLSFTSASAAADPGADGVVGGEPVPGWAWPDAVAVLGPGGRCTGTLVAPDVVLTAGHCIDVEPRTVVIGATDLADVADGERIAVAWAEAYPDWETSYDVGVVVLARAATTPVRAVARACTARTALARGREITIVGYGRSSNTGASTATKHAAAIAVTDPACRTDASCQPSIDPGGEFIAGGGGVDACFGDSGGPAYAEVGGATVVVGVVSRGLVGDTACGGGGVYVRADRVAAWIEDVTGRALVRPACGASADDPDDGAGAAVTGCTTGGGPAGLAAALLVLAVVAAATQRRGRTSSAPRLTPAA
jgi:secreted trypsin-like serine protease